MEPVSSSILRGTARESGLSWRKNIAASSVKASASRSWRWPQSVARHVPFACVITRLKTAGVCYRQGSGVRLACLALLASMSCRREEKISRAATESRGKSGSERRGHLVVFFGGESNRDRSDTKVRSFRCCFKPRFPVHCAPF